MNDVHLDDPDRLGRRHELAPAPAVDEGPRLTVVARALLGDLAGQEGTDRLRRDREGAVVGIDQHLGDDAHDTAREAARPELVPERLLDHVADLTLRLGPAHVERHGGDEPGGGLVLDEEVADLRSVAVGEDRLIALGDQLGDLAARAPDVVELSGVAVELLRPQDRVAAQGDHDPFVARCHCGSPPGPMIAGSVAGTTRPGIRRAASA